MSVRGARGARRETDLILRGVSAALGFECPAASRSRDSEIDWHDVVQTSWEHGVLPLVHRGLTSTADRVPHAVVQRLERQAGVVARRNRVLSSELIAVLSAMGAAGVRAISLKGPLLATTAYGDLSLRSFGDLDLFVAAPQVRRAMGVLRACGYRLRAPGETDVHAERRALEGVIQIDLQWALAPARFRSPLRLDQLWARVEPVDLGSAVAWQLSPPDLVLFLCSHASKHCWSKLQWITDVAACVTRFEKRIDWDRALHHATRAGGARQLLLGVRLAHDLIGAPVPAALVGPMRADPSIASLASELQGRLFEPPDDPQSFQGSYGPYRGGLLYVRTRERVRDRLPYLGHLAVRPMRRLAVRIRSFVYNWIVRFRGSERSTSTWRWV